MSTLLWSPQPGPQTDFVRCPVFEVMFGGARGGGKTEASVGEWIGHSDLYQEYASGLFLRRRRKDLDGVIERTLQLYSKLGGKYNATRNTWRMPKGSLLEFGYLERPDDVLQYQGRSFTRIYVEEAAQFPSYSPIAKLKATLRSANKVPVGMRLTSNPGGAGHQWVKERYINPAPKGYKIIKDVDEYEIDGKKIQLELERVFIPSKITDNRLLLESDPTYILQLKQTGSESLVKAWLEGDWDAVDGAYFDEWDQKIHVLYTRDYLHRIPDKAVRFRALDWGSAKPFSVGWYVVSDGTWGLPKNALLRYREWYGTKSGGNMGLKMHAKAVAEGILNREKGEVITYGVADPSIFKEDGGPSIAELMAVTGVDWFPADNQRMQGWNRIRQSLLEHELFFLDNNVHMIRTLPAIQHDEDKPEDLDTHSEDHLADELRYAVMSRYWALDSMEQPPSTPKDIRSWTITELIERNSTKSRVSSYD